MSSYSGLSWAKRREARRIVLDGVNLLWNNRGQLQYTQGPDRWQGINLDLRVDRHRYPTQSDCSSSSTWILWNALHVKYGLGDIVNGANWKAGYTGTILTHGKTVSDWKNILPGDLLVYGAGTGEHVVVCTGGGYAFSHGGPGAYKLPLNYRGGPYRIRRVI